VQVGRRVVRAKLRGTGGHMVQCAARGQVILKRLWSAWRQRRFRLKNHAG
jgi:hypothetical protein